MRGGTRLGPGETLIALLGAFARRLGERAGEGLRLLRGRPVRRDARPVPVDEAPGFVLVATLSAAAAAILTVDPWVRGLLGGASGGWRSFLKTLTSYGEGVEILVVSAAIVILCLAWAPEGLPRRIRAGLVEIGFAAAFAFAAVAGSGLAASLIKNALGRARPEYAGGIFELHPLAFTAKYASFPSGHSTTAGATAMVLALLFPRLRRAILVVGAAVALSRILLDAHFPSDAIAGFGFGAAVTLALARALAARRLVFSVAENGRLEPKSADRPANWPDVLAALIARARGAKAG